MEIDRLRALRGPNRWGRQTLIEAVLTEVQPLSDCRAFEARLRERFPAIAAPAESEAQFTLAHALERAALGLQVQAGCAVQFARTSATRESQTFLVVVEYSEEEVGRLAFEQAQALVTAALQGEPFDLDGALEKLRALDEDIRLGPSTGAIVKAAVARGIPYRRLTQGSMVQFGWGRRQRRILAAETDASCGIAESIAQNKQLTKTLLHAAGVPVPMGRSANSAEDAWTAARELGGRVVVKPRDGNQGKGVAVNLGTREEVLAAYAAAREIGEVVIVERYMTGQDYRLLVVGDKLVAAARRAPPQVRGDGARSVQQLVAELNRDPRRGDGHATILTKVKLDAIALATLAAQGYAPDSVPAVGVVVALRNNANLSTGGSATDVTDEVHPDVALRAVEAAQAIGLEVCGVDLICETVSRPLEEQGGGVVEVNAAPGLRMHLEPSAGPRREVGVPIIDAMYGESNDGHKDGRIPLVAVTGTNGKTTTVRLIGQMLASDGLCVGMTGTEGVHIGGRQIDTGDCSGPRSARSVLMHPDVDAAVLETARGGVLREGLGFDRCDVAVVTNLGEGDHLGLGFIETVEELAAVKRVIVDNVAPHGYAVLNAADALVAAMAAHCPGRVIYFAPQRDQPVLAKHLEQGGRGVYRAGGELVAEESGVLQRIPLAEIPVTHDGCIGFQVENAMAALAAGWGLGLAWDTIRAGLKDFVNDAQSVPGRFNVFEYRGATLIADYGHNPDAIAALVHAVQNMPGGRRTVVISGAGDRRDQDISRQTAILGDAFDCAVLYEDQCQRGRADGEMLALLRAGLDGASRTGEVHEVRGELKAIDLALAQLQAGDVCLILVDQVDLALAHIASQVQSQTECCT
jgi:cyanophycin synthetase